MLLIFSFETKNQQITENSYLVLINQKTLYLIYQLFFQVGVISCEGVFFITSMRMLIRNLHADDTPLKHELHVYILPLNSLN